MLYTVMIVLIVHVVVLKVVGVMVGLIVGVMKILISHLMKDMLVLVIVVKLIQGQYLIMVTHPHMKNVMKIWMDGVMIWMIVYMKMVGMSVETVVGMDKIVVVVLV
jgi:hypothetical protein